MKQLSLFEFEKQEKIVDKLRHYKEEPVEVSFRELVPEIKNTNYLTHSVYYYPAKFIPQVVRFCINEYSKKGDTVLDPFAGSGTVGLEAMITERNAILLDLNFLLEIIGKIKFYNNELALSKIMLLNKIKQIKEEKESFIPDYKNIRYWYPDEIFNVLSRYWEGVHKLDDNIYKWVIQASLIKISKLFSWAEHRTPKLFKSKYKKKFIENLLQANWHNELDKKLFEYSFKNLHSVQELQGLTRNFSNTIEVYAGVDSAKFKLNKEIDIMITSPPYLQAQEYIRTSKLDLYWLGYKDFQIKEISRLEIPYRKAERIIETETLHEIRKKLNKNKLLNILNSYFDHTISSLENNMKLLKAGGKACIFVGNPKVDGIEIKTWKILAEYFTKKDFKFEIVFEDKIKNRQLFGNRKNKNPKGMKSEYLLILSKL